MDNDKPGIGGKTFILKIGKLGEFILGEEIAIVSSPVAKGDGWEYEIQDLTGRLTKALKDNYGSEENK